MTEQEAIEELKCDNEHCFDQCEGACASIKNYKCNCQDAIIERMLDELLQYRKIGTVEECREFKEKQITKKPNVIADKLKGNTEYSCPNCGTGMVLIDKNRIQWGHIQKYCECCGQAIKN